MGSQALREMHAGIVAVMFHLAALWDIGGERLIHLMSLQLRFMTDSNPTLSAGFSNRCQTCGFR
jgi:hypothetical protein